jgi:hypothetical protein
VPAAGSRRRGRDREIRGSGTENDDRRTANSADRPATAVPVHRKGAAAAETSACSTEFEGIVTSDRWWAYGFLDSEQRQACWCHLQRDLRFHSEGFAAQKQFGETGLELIRQLFAVWHAFAEHHDRRRLAREMKPIQIELRALLEHAAEKVSMAICFSPTTAIISPRWWPSFLPTGGH